MGVEEANVKVCEADEKGKSSPQNLTFMADKEFVRLYVIQLVTFVTTRISYENKKNCSRFKICNLCDY